MTCTLRAAGTKANRVLREPTIDEILAEPIVKALMAADGVGPREILNTLHRAIDTGGRQ
jgi:hypothetical protein